MGSLLYESKKYLEQLDYEIEKIENYLSASPKGRLTCEKHKNKVRFFQNISANSEIESINETQSINGTRSITKKAWKKTNITNEPELIEKLTKKSYYTEVLMNLKEKRNIAAAFIQSQLSDDISKMYDELSDYRKKIIQPEFFCSEEFINKWKNTKYTGKIIEPGRKTYETLNREIVRSKSEKLIADSLLYNNIPYRYECPIKIKGFYGLVYPDFTILNIRTGKVIFWEHLGMMGDSEYARDAMFKLDIFAKNNIFIGEKLIISYESNEHPINTDVIKYNIEKYLQ